MGLLHINQPLIRPAIQRGVQAPVAQVGKDKIILNLKVYLRRLFVNCACSIWGIAVMNGPEIAGGEEITALTNTVPGANFETETGDERIVIPGGFFYRP